MESQLQHIDKSAFLSSSVKHITVPTRISSIFSCVVPPGCELTVVKVQQKREFDINKWKIGLKDYREVRELNSGGTVRLFKHRSTNEEIVVKEFLFVPYANSPVKPEVQFQRELETMITLRHPCVVQMLGWCPPAGDDGDDEEHSDIVLEYLRPPSLKTLLDKPGAHRWWTSTAKAKAIVGIVQAMTFIHSRNLMHRELKTRIVLFDDEHNVKIGGFGRSKFDDVDPGLRHTLASCVSLYQAPEMWGSEYTNSVDVYAFAMILYRVMMNRSPFPELRHQRPEQRKRHVQSGSRPPIGGDVVEFMRTLIEDCWSQDSKIRPSFPKIMEILDHENFKVFRDVDSAEVRRYVEMIRVKSQLL
jgi:serine/threonine protein kinase